MPKFLTAEEKLKETQARIERQIKHNITKMKESGADGMDMTIGLSDKLADRVWGASKASEMVAKMVESVPVYGGMGTDYEVVSEAHENFSFKKLREACFSLEEKGILREAGALSAYGALLRLGVTNLIAKAFKLVPLVWDKVVMQRGIDAFYMALGSTFRPTLPQNVGAGEEFPKFGVTPMSNLVEMLKWGGILEFQEEAVADDQTGELATKASEAGENMRIYQELSFAAYFSDTALSEGNLTITPLTYTDPDGSTGVYSSVTTGVQGFRQNKPASFGAVGMNTLKAARKGLKRMRDINGIKFLVSPDTLLYHPDDEQTVDVLLKSPTWPSSTNQASSTPGDSTGAVNATNPLAGYNYMPVECRYLKSTGTNGGAWFLLQRQARSLVYGNRSGLRTIMESPNAGQSFERMLQRWRCDQRGAFAWVLGGSRFSWQGNDGS